MFTSFEKESGKFEKKFPHPPLLEAVKKFPKSPPPCPSPVKGEEISLLFQRVYPLPHGERVG
jgi:hypothetical protein